MFFDIYYNSSATQCHGGNIRHLKKGIGAPVWLGEAGSFNRQPEQEEGMVLASGGGVSKEEKKTIVRQQLRPPDPLSSFEEGAKNGARARPRAKLFWVAK